jgi:STAS-like domain of unknown function (DUF4325)
MSSACQTMIPACSDSGTFMLGTRDIATPLRAQVETALDERRIPVCVDFNGLLATQSFMDEFLGPLILRHGPGVLEQIVFKNCHEDVRAAINLVATVRSNEYMASHAS